MAIGTQLCPFWYGTFMIFMPLQRHTLNYFLAILLKLITLYISSELTTFHNDQSCICRIIIAQIWLRMSVFPIFGSYPYFEFLPWLRISNTQLFKCQHIWSSASTEIVSFWLSIFHRFSRFWRILHMFESDYLDNLKR